MPIGFQKELNTKRYEINRDTNFYISPDGDDTKGGLTPDAALRTIDGLISTVVGQYTFTKGAKAYAVFAPGEYELPVQDFPILIANPIQTRDGLLFVDHQVVYDLNQFQSLRKELVDNDARQHRQISDNLIKINAAEKRIQSLVETQVDPETVVTTTHLNEAVIALHNELNLAENTQTARIDQLVAHVKNLTEKLTAVAAEKETLQKEVRDLRDYVFESFKGFHNRYETKEDFSTATKELAAENKALKERIKVLEAQHNPDRIDEVWMSLAKLYDQLKDFERITETNHTIMLEEVRGASEVASINLNMHLKDYSNPHKVRADQAKFCPELTVEKAITHINNRIKPYSSGLTIIVQDGATIKDTLANALEEYDIGSRGIRLMLHDSEYIITPDTFADIGLKVIVEGDPSIKLIPESKGTLINVSGPNSDYVFRNLVFSHPDIECSVEASNGCHVVIENCVFGDTKEHHLYADANAIITVEKGYTIQTNKELYAHAYTRKGAVINVEGCEITINNQLKVDYFAVAHANSSQSWLGTEINGKIDAAQTLILELDGTIQGSQNIENTY